MKFKRTVQVQCVCAKDPKTFERELNEILERVDDPEITFKDGWSAIVKFTMEKYIPETKAEEYELKGMGCSCEVCPFFMEMEDRRLKWHYCGQYDRKVMKSSPCCDAFYELMERRSDVPGIRKENEGEKPEDKGSRQVDGRDREQGFRLPEWAKSIQRAGEDRSRAASEC